MLSRIAGMTLHTSLTQWIIEIIDPDIQMIPIDIINTVEEITCVQVIAS